MLFELKTMSLLYLLKLRLIYILQTANNILGSHKVNGNTSKRLFDILLTI